jgi:serine-type D-Ala-D-Ala carboxypeptidase (penicillin-binding protein 5/6)
VPPELRGAKSAIVVEASTGEVAYARASRVHREIASTTKLMTALVTLENADLDEVFEASNYHPAAVESQIGLRPGERMSVRDLLRALMLPSANDAAMALAIGVSGTRSAFVRRMNREAAELGLRDTHYANPIGLDAAGNYSSAADLVKLAITLRRNEFARETMDRPRAILRTGARTRTVLNRNTLVRTVPYVNGVKTGHTQDAGYVLVGSATRNGITVVSAVLGEPSEAARDADSLALLRYGLAQFHRVTAISAGHVVARPKLDFRDQHVDVVAKHTIRRTVRRGERFSVEVHGVPSEVEGPIARGTRVGTAIVRLGGEEIARVPLVTATAVSKASFADQVRDLAKRIGVLWIVGVALIGSLLAMVLRRRALRRRRAVRRRERRAA